MICTVIKGFALSRDGVTSEWAGKGERVDIPNEMVAGLVKEKFIGEASDLKAAAHENKALVGAEETQALTAAPENKAVAAAPENKSADSAAAKTDPTVPAADAKKA